MRIQILVNNHCDALKILDPFRQKNMVRIIVNFRVHLPASKTITNRTTVIFPICSLY